MVSKRGCTGSWFFEGSSGVRRDGEFGHDLMGSAVKGLGNGDRTDSTSGSNGCGCVDVVWIGSHWHCMHGSMSRWDVRM